MRMIDFFEGKVSLLNGGHAPIWDICEQKIVKSFQAYIPWGCPDWGEKDGKRNELCTFCSIPNSVIGYCQSFYGGKIISMYDHIELFKAVLMLADRDIHTLKVFNGGSFLSMPLELQYEILKAACNYPNIKHIVIESRAALITKENVREIFAIFPSWKRLTIRIGVETQDDYLRLKVLKKGHTRNALKSAVKVLDNYGIISGGYALLNPAPGMDVIIAIKEAIKTFEFIFDELGMDEAYFCSANVGPGSVLADYWQKGEFAPANLWSVLMVLKRGVKRYGKKIHLLSFREEPEFLAIPSNHVPKGIAQNLKGAMGCDLEFYGIFEKYRKTMDPKALEAPSCICRPAWF